PEIQTMIGFLKRYIKGDKYLWAFIVFLAIFSFLPVYSASSNLVYTVGSGSVISHIGKHAFFLIVGLIIIVALQRVDYKYFGGLALLGLPIVVIMLIATIVQGNTIEGANAARWLKLPGTSITIQTSTFASMVLLVYIARYLTKIRNREVKFTETVFPLFFPMFVIIGLIFPANGSTAAMLFIMAMTLLFLGGFPIKYLVGILITGVVAGGIFVYVAYNHADMIPNSRVHTWKSRIDNFSSGDGLASYQVQHAKAAINRGGVFNLQPGKSVFKHTLPQSSSDFIYAIIVEEYGMFGGALLLFLFLLVLF